MLYVECLTNGDRNWWMNASLFHSLGGKFWNMLSVASQRVQVGFSPSTPTAESSSIDPSWIGSSSSLSPTFCHPGIASQNKWLILLDGTQAKTVGSRSDSRKRPLRMGTWDWVVHWEGWGRGQWSGDDPWHAIAAWLLVLSPVTDGAEIQVEGAFAFEHWWHLKGLGAMGSLRTMLLAVSC